MRKKLTVLAAGMALLLVVSVTAAPLQQTPNPPRQVPPLPPSAPGAPTQPTPPSAPTPSALDKTYEGRLTKVDLAAKLIIVMGDDQKEMTFVYNEQTQMSGVESSPQGLNGQTGSTLRVTYREGRGINVATKIEVVQKQV